MLMAGWQCRPQYTGTKRCTADVRRCNLAGACSMHTPHMDDVSTSLKSSVSVCARQCFCVRGTERIGLSFYASI